MSNKATGLKEIAYEVGYSINTVSRALRDCDDIAESTKEVIRKKAYELGYMPNTISQFLKRDNRKLVGILTGNFYNFFFTIMCEKLIKTLGLKGFDYTLLVKSSDEEEADKDLIKQCISQRVDVLISLVEMQPSAMIMAKQNGLNIVCLGNNIDSANDYVGPSTKDGCNIAANYLINFHGINKLLYVGWKDKFCFKHRCNVSH